MAAAAASTGTADAAKCRIDTEAIESCANWGTIRLGIGGLKKCKRVESARARFGISLALMGVLERAPERCQREEGGNGL
jgi:hypothetical protein